MSPNFEQVAQQIKALPVIEKQALRQLLDEELSVIKEDSVEKIITLEREQRSRQIEWLKAHRNEYAGQYVALDGDILVGHGSTIRQAHEQATTNGVKQPFLVRVFAEETVVSAGL